MWSVVRLRSQRSTGRMKKTQSERKRTLERQFGTTAPTDNKFLRSVYWALRGCQYWLCFYDDEAEIDIEDLLSNPFNTQPPSLDQLQQLTGFDRQWLMFMYRNFKQKCSNGRMTITDWRSIFRTIFPYSANNQFADRLYNAIANAHDHPHITFEDLILCLWELTEGARNSDLSHEQQPGVSVKAQFVFGLMAPDARGRVDEAAFYEYVHSVFNLYGSKKMDDSVTLGLPPSSLHQRMTVADVRPLPPNVRKFAVERFRSLDENNDGFITVYDIEREMNEGRGLVLLSLRDIDQASNEVSSQSRTSMATSS
ncbi:hypothetical protein Q1695_011748 [Nippostrongylus brasiliensis]|nr:hypothetical protein Q1695_011748 [Nippostrongylus brasiliensis]